MFPGHFPTIPVIIAVGKKHIKTMCCCRTKKKYGHCAEWWLTITQQRLINSSSLVTAFRYQWQLGGFLKLVIPKSTWVSIYTKMVLHDVDDLGYPHDLAKQQFIPIKILEVASNPTSLAWLRELLAVGGSTGLLIASPILNSCLISFQYHCNIDNSNHINSFDNTNY